eukprot:364853-Chlamydomonas_euryale.AAC.1
MVAALVHSLRRLFRARGGGAACVCWPCRLVRARGGGDACVWQRRRQRVVRLSVSSHAPERVLLLRRGGCRAGAQRSKPLAQRQAALRRHGRRRWQRCRRPAWVLRGRRT